MGRDRPEKVLAPLAVLAFTGDKAGRDFPCKKLGSHRQGISRLPGARWSSCKWIKRGDGSLVTFLPEDKSYCHKRNGELEQRKLALKGKLIHYSGEDLEGISQSVAEQWIKAWQKGTNLQQLDLNFWQVIVRGLGDLSNATPGYSFYATFQSGDHVLYLEAEEQ